MTPAAFIRFKSGQTEISDDLQREYYSIDKCWYDFHLLFKTLGPPLSSALDGDYHPPDCPPDLDSFADGSYPSDFYIAVVSSPVVAEIARSLERMTDREVAELRQLSKVEPDSYFKSCFTSMQSAYSLAASKENCLLFTVC